MQAARAFTRITLLGFWGMDALTDLAELVVSELATNALRHGVPSARKIVSEHCCLVRSCGCSPRRHSSMCTW